MSTRVIRPDEGNLIDLPGVGARPRPVDIDQSVTGFAKLKSLRAYRFKASETIEGESEIDEVLIASTSGPVRIEIAGPHPLEVRLAAEQVLYMPPDHAYRLTPETDTVVAYARAQALGKRATRVIDGNSGGGEAIGFWQVVLAPGDPVDLAGETLALVVSGIVEVAEDRLDALCTLSVEADTSAQVRAATETALWIYTP